MTNIDIISYKHGGELHRVWRNVNVLEQNEKMMVLMNNRVEVIDGDGRKWKTREPAICFFFKDHWFNIISMLRNNAVYYYCNLSSPFLVDQEGIKYIDYDLDVKLFPDGAVLLLDRDEYDFNIKYLHYSKELTQIIRYNLEKLLIFIKEKRDPFNQECIDYWYQKYLDMEKSETKIKEKIAF